MSDAAETIPRSAATLRTQQILHGDLTQRIFVLALPTLLQQLLTFCVGLFDTWLSGRIDAAATSAIGIAAYIGWLAGLFVSTVSIGTTALVARSLGAHQPDQANRVLHVALVCGQLVSLTITAFLYTMAPVFVSAFQLQGTTAEIGLNYLRMDSVGHLLAGMTYVGSAALRGSGDMARPMLVLGAINLLNMAVSCCCVYGVGPDGIALTSFELIPAMGVYGIAAGTVTARLAGGLLMTAVLLRGSGALRLRFRQLNLDRSLVRRLYSMGVYAAGDNLVTWLGQFCFLIIIRNVTGTPFSADVIFAAHMVGLQVEAITYLPAIAWGQSAATIVGQCLGAGKLKRAFRAGLGATLQCCALGLLVSVVFFTGAEHIYRVMHRDTSIVAAGTEPFRMLALFQIPLMISMVLKIALHGAGDTRWPMLATVIGTILVRLPMAWLFGVMLELGLLGAWMGMCIDIMFKAAVLFWRYAFSRRWLQKKI